MTRDKEKELIGKKTMEADMKDSGIDFFDEVDEETMAAEVLSVWTGIPVYKLTKKKQRNFYVWKMSCWKRQ